MNKTVQKRAKKKNAFVICMLIWPLLQFAVFYVYMNFNNIMLAFKGMRENGSTYWAGLSNFKEALTGVDSEILLISLKNNIIMFFIMWFIGMPLNILFGYYLYKKKPGYSVIRVIYMLPGMISGIVVSMLFMKFVEEALPVAYLSLTGKILPNLLRNNNTAFAMQIVYSLWLGFSTSIIIYSNAMNSIDPEIFEAGRIDGTNNLTEIVLILIPMMMPTLSTYIITGFAGILTGSGSLFVFYGLNDVPKNTYFLGYYLFKIAMTGDLTAYPRAAAVSVLMTIVTVPVTLLVRWILDRIDPMRDNYKVD